MGVQEVYEESWGKWSVHVLSELERFNKCLAILNQRHEKIESQLQFIKGALYVVIPLVLSTAAAVIGVLIKIIE